MSENSPHPELHCRCPESYPSWDGTDQSLAGQTVHRMSIASFFHMPLAYESYVGKQLENVEQLGLSEKWPGFVLTKTGMWGGEIIRFIEDAETASRCVQILPPPFDVNVMLHEGGIGTVQKTLRAQQMKIVDSGKKPKELYLAYLSCPVCAERKGGEKILLFRRWLTSERLVKKIEQRASK